MNRSSLVKVILPTVASLLAIFPSISLAQTNDWTKPASGAWEEPFWSLGGSSRLNADFQFPLRKWDEG